MRKLLLSSALVVLAACTTADEPSDVSVARGLSPKIVNGTTSTASQDDAVLLYWLDTVNNRLGGLCTATVVAPNLVMTARHCVALSDEQVACDSNGTPLIGANVGVTHNAQDLYVFTGVNRPAFAGDQAPELDTTKWQPAGRGKQILDDGSTTLCNHDIAFVLLENPIANVPIASLQLDGEPTAGEKLTTVGWGVTTQLAEPGQRQQRTNVTVKRDGPSDLSPTLTPSEFLFSESICSGDSGGPIFAQSTGGVVGVVSRGGNGTDGTSDPSSTCTGNVSNLGTKLSAFKPFIQSAFTTAGATPKVAAAPTDDDSSGCAVAESRSASTPSSSTLLGLAALILLRRKKRRERHFE